MKKVKKESKHRKEMKKKLEKIGYHLFSDFGIRKVTMRMLAKDASISAGLTYSYYENKYALLNNILAHYLDYFKKEIDRSQTKELTQANFWDAVSNYFSSVLAYHRLFRIFLLIDLEHYPADVFKQQIKEIIDQQISAFSDFLTFENQAAEDFHFYMRCFTNEIIFQPDKKNVSRFIAILQKYYGRN